MKIKDIPEVEFGIGFSLLQDHNFSICTRLDLSLYIFLMSVHQVLYIIFSCTPDKGILVFYLGWYLRRPVMLVFTAIMSKNDVALCKLDVNVKNRTAVAGSVGFFKLKQKLFKGNSITL